MLPKGWLRGKSEFTQLFVLFLLALTSLSLFIFIGQAIMQLLGFPIFTNPDMISDFENPEYLPFIKFFQILYSIGAFLTPPLIFTYFMGYSLRDYLYLKGKIKLHLIALTFLIVIVALPLINIIGHYNSMMDLPDFLGGLEEWMKASEEQMGEFTEAVLEMNSTPAFLLNLFMLALLPAVGEELIFRGTVQKIFTQATANAHWGIWISAIIFSAIHVQFYGFFPRMLLGALFGYLLVWSKNMWYPIIAHFVNNGTAVVLSFLTQRGTISEEAEDVGATKDTWFYALISVAFLAYLLYRFYRQSTKKAISN